MVLVVVDSPAAQRTRLVVLEACDEAGAAEGVVARGYNHRIAVQVLAAALERLTCST